MEDDRMTDNSAWDVSGDRFFIRISHKDLMEYGEIDLESDIIEDWLD